MLGVLNFRENCLAFAYIFKIILIFFEGSIDNYIIDIHILYFYIILYNIFFLVDSSLDSLFYSWRAASKGVVKEHF